MQSNLSLLFCKDVEENVTRWTINRGGEEKTFKCYESALMFVSSNINIILFLSSGFLLVFAWAGGYWVYNAAEWMKYKIEIYKRK